MMRGFTGIRRLSASLAIVGIAAFGNAAAQDMSDSHWSVTPYLWGPTTKVDLKFQNSVINDEISFSDLLDTIDVAGMLHFEGGAGRWSYFADITYLDTSEVDERTLLAITTDSKQSFVDMAVAYWPGGIDRPFNLFGGVRYSGFDDRYTFRLVQDGSIAGTRRNSSDYYDVLLGLRYRFDLSSRWSLLTRADASFGDSDGTFLLRANFGYAIGGRQENRLLVGYQYKEADFDDAGLKTAFQYHGPMAGFSFRF